jgi:TPR repeat protein
MDKAKAAVWIRNAADQGDAKAQFILGSLYSVGKIFQKDDIQAAIWVCKAAEQGDVDAEAFLGFLYYKGKGVTQDYAEAAVWIHKAAEQDNALAQGFLGGLYGNGEGVKQSNADAYFWLDVSITGLDEAQQHDAIESRDRAAEKLTPAGLKKVQKRVAKWRTEHPTQS